MSKIFGKRRATYVIIITSEIIFIVSFQNVFQAIFEPLKAEVLAQKLLI
jgi:hypothetical protein